MLLVGTRPVWIVQSVHEASVDSIQCAIRPVQAVFSMDETVSMERGTLMYGGSAIASISNWHGMLLPSGHQVRAEGCLSHNLPKVRSFNLLPA